jgi:hypothetical protein
MATINNIKAGAMAYSPDGMRPWGAVPTEKRSNVTLGTVLGEKVVINSPLWTLDPQRKFSVERIYIEIVTVPEEPPTQPPNLPPPDEVTMRWLKDGEVFTTQNYVKKVG